MESGDSLHSDVYSELCRGAWHVREIAPGTRILIQGSVVGKADMFAHEFLPEWPTAPPAENRAAQLRQYCQGVADELL